MFARRIRFAITAVAVAAVLATLFAFRGPLARATVAAAVDLVTGYQVSFAGLTLGTGRATVRGLHVSRAGERLLDADAADIAYDLRDAVSGGVRRYGLQSIVLDRPRLYVVRHADGSFNVSGSPAGNGPAGTPVSAPAGAQGPLVFTATVRNGSVVLLDPNRVLPIARRLGIDGIDGNATVNTAARTTYALAGHVAGAPSQRFEVRGRIDASGYAVHRLHAATVAAAPISDYFINTHSAEVLSGTARDVDVRVYSFGPRPDGSAPYHITGSGMLEGGSIHLPGFAVPATGMHGRIDVTDDALVARSLDARVGSLPVRIAGGLYDREGPAFRLGIVASHAPLEAVRTLFHFSRNLPLTGDVGLATLLEGVVGSPLVVTSVAAPAIAYRDFPVEGVRGRAIYYGSAIDVAGAQGTYGGLDVRANGAIALGDVVHTQLVTDVRGPAARVPYAAQVAPLATLHATALLEGDGLRLDARGTGDGAGGGTALSAVFHVHPDGEGALGPIAVARADGSSAAGAFFLHRRASESGFWLDARDYPVARVPSDPHLPGIALAPPIFDGRIDGSLAGVGPPSDFRIAGTVRARGLDVGDVHIDDVRGNLAGRFSDVTLGAIAATGSWGAFSGTGAYRGGTLALAGNYRGGFAQLREFTGDLGARGPIDGPVALLISPDRTVVQARGDGSPGATVRGVPVDQLRGTLSVARKTVRVYAATARVANGTFAAAGTVDGQHGVGVSVADADGRQLHAIAPLGAGSVAAIGDVRTNASATRFDGGVAVANATVDRLPLDGSSDMSLTSGRLEVRATDAVLGAAVGTIAGSLDGLGTRAPRYDLGVHLTATRVAPFAQAMLPERHDIAGTFGGDARITGTPSALSVTGTFNMPEGTVNGLAFRDVTAGFALTPGGASLRNGHVTVGTTVVNLGGMVAGGDAALHLDAPSADLSDFNDYFDTGDTLSGKGRVDFEFTKRGEGVSTGAGIDIAALRYRRFDLGDASAWWTSRGPDVSGKVAFGGTSGRLDLAGTVAVLPRSGPLIDRLRANGTAHLRGLDLGVWLPALGYDLPVSGRVDADATIAGPLRDPDMRTNFALVGGSIGRFPVDRLDVATTSTLNRTTITHATIELPGVSASGSGSFGLDPRDPLTLALHLKTPNVGALAARMADVKTPVTGAAEVDVKVDGTTAHPRVAGGFDLENATVAGVAIPQALGEFTIAGRDIVLSDAEVGFAKGTLYLAGSVPLQVAPFGFGPAAAPITLDFNAKGIDLANFAPLLPAGSTLQGAIDGHVAIGGTAGSPRLDGSLALASGALRAPFETAPLQNVAAQLSFSGNSMSLDSLHAATGGGSLDASGNVRFANLVRPGTAAAYQFRARAQHLTLDLPAYGSGVVDGTFALTHTTQAIPVLSADLALSDATIPFSALLLLGGLSSTFGSPGLQTAMVSSDSNVALDLALTSGRNVRVRSANVDIGARGELYVSGTRAAPVLSGGFDSAGGGTLSYFNTVFRVIDGRVTFSPDLGVIPNLEAHAVTHVPNPDPNTVRNLTGSADVTLDIRGPVTNLSIALSSDPSYDRQQILGLLLNAPALGASNLFSTSGQATLYGTTTTNLPAGVVATRNASGQFSVAQEAFGIANAQFTRTLLSPIESSVAEAVGLTNIAVNVDYGGNVGLTARKVLGKKINAIYGTSFGYPYRQTFGFEVKPNDSEAAQVTVFQTLGAYGLNSLAPVTLLSPQNLKVQEAEPSQGTAGFSLSLQKLF